MLIVLAFVYFFNLFILSAIALTGLIFCTGWTESFAAALYDKYQNHVCRLIVGT